MQIHVLLSRRVAKLAALVALLACLGASGCAALTRSAVASTTNTIAEGLLTSILAQPDPELVRQGMPAFLLTLDGLIATDPENPKLLRSAAAAYTSYCHAFIADSDNSRAVKLFARARDYGFRLLRMRPFFDRVFPGNDLDAYRAALEEFTVEDAPDLHTAAAAWLGWIIAASDSMAALADLPQALALMERALALAEDYGDGSGHLVFAIFNVVQPRGAGQDLARSRRHFERAIELAGDRNMLAQVLYAEFYGRATLDKDFFTSRLENVLAVDPAAHPATRLLNELAHEKAKALLARRDDFF